MKKVNNLVVMAIFAVLLAVSCTEEPSSLIQPVEYTVKINFGESFSNISTSGIVVTLKNTTNEEEYSLVSNENGNIQFNQVTPGTYDIKATKTFTKQEYEAFFGVKTSQENVNFNGSAENVLINSDGEMSKTIALTTSKIGDLLIKQIYYAGSDVREGAVFRDMFFEIYNNSNEVIYADGLYFAQVYGRTVSSVKTYTLANGQYDWTKSLEQTKGDKSNTDYIYTDHVIRFPGAGKEYPIQPGESIVVAGTAINHKKPLIVGDREYSIKKPELTIDLSNADFETYYQDYWVSNGKAGIDSDIDNPGVPNMKIAYELNQKELLLDPLGRDSFVIFRTSKFDSYAKVPNPQSKSITSRTKLYKQIPNDIIIDGVEVRKPDLAKAAPRRLSVSIDGGQMSVPEGSYSSQAIIRKVVKTFGDRKVLQDTNNSENDFEVLNIPVPGGWK